MTYTISLDFWLDDNEVISDDKMVEMIKELLDGTAWGVTNIKILDVSD